jgi:hypothetical protein
MFLKEKQGKPELHERLRSGLNHSHSIVTQPLEPWLDSVSARSNDVNTVSDTENPVRHLTAFAGPHRRIHARFV